jgi:hypothetical protein
MVIEISTHPNMAMNAILIALCLRTLIMRFIMGLR